MNRISWRNPIFFRTQSKRDALKRRSTTAIVAKLKADYDGMDGLEVYARSGRAYLNDELVFTAWVPEDLTAVSIRWTCEENFTDTPGMHEKEFNDYIAACRKKWRL